MFKVGEKIVCINEHDPKKKFYFHLTENKIYTSCSSLTENSTWVKNDTGIIADYPNTNFTSLSECRKLKLEKICSRLETK